MDTKISSSISSLYERQIGWLEAREKKMLSTTAVLRSKDSIDHTFNPKRPDKSTRCMFTSTLKESHQGSPQKKCGLIAHESHVRRYAKARADKKRQTAALTWSAFRREVRARNEIYTYICTAGQFTLQRWAWFALVSRGWALIITRMWLKKAHRNDGSRITQTSPPERTPLHARFRSVKSVLPAHSAFSSLTSSR